MHNLKKDRRLLALWRRLSATPHLTKTLVLLALLLIIADAYLALIAQPIHYWLDYDYATDGGLWAQQMLAIHPLFFTGAALVYLAVVGLVLRELSSRFALILWMPLCFAHLWNAAGLLRRGLYRFFGLGDSATLAVSMAIFVVVAAILGLGLARALPSMRKPTPDVVAWSKPSRRATIVALIGLLLLALGIVRATYIPDTGWRPIVTEHRPPPRMKGDIVYDTRRGKAVLFGGQSAEGAHGDTWEWDGDDWVERFSDKSPSARDAHAMAYDAARGVTVLFGGRNDNEGSLNDTWEWDGEQWTQRHPLTSPPARCCHSMVYDTQRRRVILYGGYDDETTFHTQGWGWDGETWSQVMLEPQHVTTSGSDLAYDESLDRIVAFLGGYTWWTWQGATWTQQPLTIEPPGRRHEGLIYDAANKQLVLFGGEREKQSLNDTWVLAGETWRKLDLPLSPTARWAHMMFYDPNRRRVIIFGGFGQDYLDDMWELVLPDDE